MVRGQVSAGLKQIEHHVVNFINLFLLAVVSECKVQNQLKISLFLDWHSAKPRQWILSKSQNQLEASGFLVWCSAIPEQWIEAE